MNQDGRPGFVWLYVLVVVSSLYNVMVSIAIDANESLYNSA